MAVHFSFHPLIAPAELSFAHRIRKHVLAADINREIRLLCIKAHAAILLGLAAIAQAQDQYMACGWINFIMRFKSGWPLAGLYLMYI